MAGILKGRKRVRQKEGNIHLSSSLPSRALYPATRAFCIQLLTLFGYSHALYLLARPLSNRALQSPLFAIAKQMCVNILLENYKYKNSKALRILNIRKFDESDLSFYCRVLIDRIRETKKFLSSISNAKRLLSSYFYFSN